MYNWQLPNWPRFTYDSTAVGNSVNFEKRAARLSGMVEAMSDKSREETIVEVMISEAIKTSAIEGELLSREDVAPSLRRNLGLRPDLKKVHDQRALGAAALMVDARRTFADRLSKESLYSWHKMLMRGSAGINPGQWRSGDEPMQVISGALGRETIHFVAPPSTEVSSEMQRFITWFNETAADGALAIQRPVVRSAIAHVYFESIHPFEDGNGRIGRCISEKVLAQGLGHPVILSLSRTIESDRKAYYDQLQRAQKSIDLTEWISYFQEVVLASQREAEESVDFTLKKVRFMDRYRAHLGMRQEKAIQRMLEAGSSGFEGGMTAQKYMKITKTSKATATRDLRDLTTKGILVPSGGGRNTRYGLQLEF